MAKKKGKKKSGAKLLARMTEEERILYLEQKALAEAEMRKKKEEMLTFFLKVSAYFVLSLAVHNRIADNLVTICAILVRCWI